MQREGLDASMSVNVSRVLGGVLEGRVGSPSVSGGGREGGTRRRVSMVGGDGAVDAV